MSDQQDLARKHLEALLAEAQIAKIPKDVAGRAMLAQLVECWLEDRKGRSPHGHIQPFDA